jgi:hypothetical protein
VETQQELLSEKPAPGGAPAITYPTEPFSNRWTMQSGCYAVLKADERILAASLCLIDVAFRKAFRKNTAALSIFQKNNEVMDKETAVTRDFR